MWNLLGPLLYATVELRSSSQCLITLPTLLRNSLARNIKRLAVHPNSLVWTIQASEDTVDEDLVASLIESLAKSACLHNLTSFAWSGLEVPLDSLWRTLRILCVYLF